MEDKQALAVEPQSYGLGNKQFAFCRSWVNYKVFNSLCYNIVMDEAQKKVLLVEDDQFLAALLKNRLQKENFDVTLAKNGEEALKNLDTFVPDLILLDIILPGKSGFEILEEMHAHPNLSKVPVLIISNLGQESDISRGKELGALGYFVKARTSIDEVINQVKKTVVPQP